MSYLKFALKRFFKSAYPILVLLCAVLVYLASFGGGMELPAAGVCDMDGSAQSASVLEYLLDNGFVKCGSEQQLEELIAKGELDCGTVLPEGFAKALERGETEGLIRFVDSPSSFAPEIYRYHVAAAVFKEAAPYISAAAFEGSELSREEVLAAYEACFEDGYAFSFDVQTVDGFAAAEDIRKENLLTGCAGVLLFLLLVSGAAGLLDEDFYALRGRIGFSRSFCLVVLPGLGARLLCAVLPMTLAALAAGEAWLIPGLWIFALLMTDAALLLSAILPGKGSLAILLPLLLTASLALCPIFIDTAALFPALKGLRAIIPPWWLWPLQERPLMWLAAGVLGFAAGAGLFALRGKLRKP